jgi:G3E family GTPase
MRVGVLVNDFGSINIDADLVVDVESDVISLANGCVCCSIRDDLSEAVIQVMERPERPEYILWRRAEWPSRPGSPSPLPTTRRS